MSAMAERPAVAAISRILVAVALAAALSAGAVPQARAGGAWARDPGSFYLKLGASSISASKLYDRTGTIVDTTRYSGLTLSLYGELGLAPGLAAMADLPFLRRQTLAGRTMSGIGDAAVMLKYSVSGGDWPVAFSLGVGIPTGDTLSVPPAGDGEIDGRFALHVSHASESGRTYISASGGYNLHGHGLNDELMGTLEGGWRPADPLWLTLALRMQKPVGKIVGSKISGYGVGEGVEFEAFGLGATWEAAPHLGLTVGFEGGFHAKNIPAGANLLAGISYSR